MIHPASREIVYSERISVAPEPLFSIKTRNTGLITGGNFSPLIRLQTAIRSMTKPHQGGLPQMVAKMIKLRHVRARPPA